jgi:O-antigen/teichoic acid export membrane protein
LFLGRSISTVILAVGTIILGLFISAGDYGLYTIALIPATTFLLFQDWGVGAALTRYCAKYRATHEMVEQRKIIVAGLIFEAATGIVLTVVSILLAGFIAYTLFGRPESALLIAVSSITILTAALGTATSTIFVGFEQMKLTSYAALIQAIAYSVAVPLLVYFGYGAVGAIIGFTLSSVASAVIQLIFLYFFIFRKLPHSRTIRSDIYRTLKTLLNFGIPLNIATIFSGLSGSLYSFVMAAYVSIAIIGNYKIATNFALLLSFLTFPIVTVLFPAFSKVDPQKEKNLLKTVFASSVKYTVLLVIPATMAMIVLSKPLIGTIYGNKWPYAPLFLSLNIVYNLLSVFGWRSMGQFLPAMGETKLVMKLNLLNLLISIPLAFLLIPPLGMIGVIIGGAASALPGTFIGIYLEWKRYGVKADFRASAKILFATALASVTVYLFLNFFNAAYWILFVVGAILFLAVYLISAPLVGAINQTDVNTLRAMFSGLGIISKLLEIPLKIIEKTLKTLKPQANMETC